MPPLRWVGEIGCLVTFAWHWEKLGLEGTGDGELLLQVRKAGVRCKTQVWRRCVDEGMVWLLLELRALLIGWPSGEKMNCPVRPSRAPRRLILAEPRDLVLPLDCRTATSTTCSKSPRIR